MNRASKQLKMAEQSSILTCNHAESLIYFDRVYGDLCSWEECMQCGMKHNQITLEEAPQLIDDLGPHDD